MKMPEGYKFLEKYTDVINDLGTKKESRQLRYSLDLMKEMTEAIEFAYRWSLENTPEIRPYNLTDRMRKCLDKWEKWE